MKLNSDNNQIQVEFKINNALSKLEI